MGLIVLSTQRYVQHDRAARIYRLYSADTRIDQGRETVGMPDIPFRPDHAVIDLAAYLYHIGQSSLSFQGGNYFFCIVINGLLQMFEIFSFPGSWLELFARVRP